VVELEEEIKDKVQLQLDMFLETKIRGRIVFPLVETQLRQVRVRKLLQSDMQQVRIVKALMQ
jgi:hypothetical protein